MKPLCIACLYILVFLQMMDSSAVNLSVPEICADLGIDAMHASWIMTSFGTGMVISLPFASALGKTLSDDGVLLIGIVLFDISSLVCGVANTSNVFLFARFVQGVGAGFCSASAFPILLRQFSEEKTTFATSLYTSAVSLGPVCGPAIGSYLTDAFGWQSVFLLNLPLIGGASLLLLPSLELSRKHSGAHWAKKRSKTLLCFAISVACFQYFVDFGEQSGWLSDPTLALVLAAAVLFGCAFLYFNRDDAAAVFDFRLFNNRQYRDGTLVLALCNGLAYCSIVLLPIWLRLGRNMSISMAGMVMVVASVISAIGSPLIGRHLKKTHFYGATLLSLALMSASLFLMAAFKPDSSLDYMIFCRIVAGISFCTLTMPLLSQSLQTLGADRRTEAQALSVTLRITCSNIFLALSFSYYGRLRFIAHEDFVSDPTYFRNWDRTGISAAAANLLEHKFETRAFSEMMILGGFIFAALCIAWAFTPKGGAKA